MKRATQKKLSELISEASASLENMRKPHYDHDAWEYNLTACIEKAYSLIRVPEDIK